MPPPAAARPRTWREPGLQFGDYAYAGGRIILRKTGNSARLDLRLIAEVAGWLLCLAIVVARAVLLRPFRRDRPAIFFTPDVPHPRYMVRIAAIWAGMRVAPSADKAAIAFAFEDATRGRPVTCEHLVVLNAGCTDITKSRVAAVFEQAFGYALALDPSTWMGDAVEKSESNGTHDGRVVVCPCSPVSGRVYQRLVDTVRADGFAYDLRTHCTDGRPLVVWEKRRDPRARFLPPNIAATRRRPEAVFSPAELAGIARFVQLMGADWCSLDILRDRDGRIYIVDLNKTDAGPIVALPLPERLRGVAILAAALQDLVSRRAAASASLRPARRRSSR